MSTRAGVRTQHIKIYWCYVCMLAEIKWDRGECDCHHQFAQAIRAKMMLKRLVLNMQPTPSAIFSRTLESVCFSALCIHVIVWVRVLPRDSISLYEILHSLAPSMGRKCKSSHSLSRLCRSVITARLFFNLF